MKTEPLPADIAATLRRMSGEDREEPSAAITPEPVSAPLVGTGELVGPLAARHWKAPFRYDAEGAMIWDANNKRALDVRGWGYLTGKGALGLSADEAEMITADFGQSVVAILNAQWPNNSDVGPAGTGATQPKETPR